MTAYKRRVATIEATQWDGPGGPAVEGVVWNADQDAYVVETPNGPVILAPLDYVVTDEKGQRWPMGRAKFESLYELA